MLNDRDRREFEGIEFAPAGGRKGYYNLWQGFAVEPRPGDCGKFLAHIRDNIAQGNTFLYNWIVGFFAQIAQKPDVKVGTALALRGEPGVGKTKVGEVFGSLLKPHYKLVADPRFVTGQFNSHMVRCCCFTPMRRSGPATSGARASSRTSSPASNTFSNSRASIRSRSAT